LPKIYCQQGTRQPGEIISYRRSSKDEDCSRPLTDPDVRPFPYPAPPEVYRGVAVEHIMRE
jgi:hypothetical protein